jgi:hypothetical protein
VKAVSTKPAATTDLPLQVFAGGAAANSQANAVTPVDGKKQERLQKIRQLTFDRRPAAILKAWSTPRVEAIKNVPAPAAQPGMAMTTAMPRATRRVLNGAVTTTPPPAMIIAPNTAVGAALETSARNEPDPFDRDLRGLQYDVTTSDWAGVKAFLKKLPEGEGKAAYEQLIQGLGSPPVNQGNMQMQQMQMQQMQIQMQMNIGMSFGAGGTAPPNPQ